MRKRYPMELVTVSQKFWINTIALFSGWKIP